MKDTSSRNFKSHDGKVMARKEISFREDEPKPLPLGDKCNYLCPYFRCNKKALSIQVKYVKGTPQKLGLCRWVGDTCITGDCQYAYCEKRALLPGNKCAFAVSKKVEEEEAIEREFKKVEEEEAKLREMISKKLGRKEYDLL